MIGVALAAALLTATGGHTYALVIGNNTPLGGDEELSSLRYADDDAAAVSEFLLSTGADVTLLSVLDSETQQRYADLVPLSQPPTRAKLLQATERIGAEIGLAATRGERTTLWFFFSGHGQLTADKQPALALLDAGLTQEMLYSLLDRLPADVVHLIVDACHAEAVVHVREVPDKSMTVVTTAADFEAFASRKSLARFPNVGAIIATASDQPAHEWSLYENGIFTHQLLSALRGAADVNDDLRIEYSELHAFLLAANREIQDPRAKLSVLLKPPPIDQRAPLVDLRDVGHAGWLTMNSPGTTRFWIEDGRGARLADVNREGDALTHLVLPAETELFVRTSSNEGRFSLAPGQHLAIEKVGLHSSAIASRGAISTALSRGLFSAAYGPVYYRGFVDSSGELSVDFPTPGVVAIDAVAPRRTLATALWVSAGVAAAAAGVFAGLAASQANVYNTTPSDSAAQAAQQHYSAYVAASVLSGGLALAGTVAGLLSYPWVVAPSMTSDGHGLALSTAGHF